MTARWQLSPLDNDRRRRGVSPVARVELNLRWPGPSTWTASTPQLDGVALPLPGDRVLITRDGDTILSGIVTRRELRVDSLAGRTVDLEGIDDAGRLDELLAYPDPTLPADDAGQPARDVRTGPVGELIAGYIDDNVGPSSPRPLDGLVVPDAGDVAGLGATVTGRARYRPLATFLGELVERAGGGVDYRLEQAADSTDVDLVVRETQDRPGVVFDVDALNAAGLLRAATIRTDRPTATVAIVGGPGEDADRLVVEQPADAADVAAWGRIETWLDRRNAGDDSSTAAELTDELVEDADEALDEAAATVDLDVDVADAPAVGWPDRWRIGDRVVVRVDGVEDLRRVRGVDVTVDASGERVRARFGSPSATRLLRLVRRIGELERTTERIARG